MLPEGFRSLYDICIEISSPRILEEAVNCFCYYLDLLPTRSLRAHLALLCAQPGQSLGFAQQPMKALQGLGLVYRHGKGWKPTWLGLGVNNWHRQQEAARHINPVAPLPEPRPGENGQDHGPACTEFRELYFRPGFCWCGRPAALHPRCAPEFALEFLRWHNLSQQSTGPGTAHSQTHPVKRLAHLTSVERAVLQTIWDHPRIQFAGLVGFFAGLFGYGQIKAALASLVTLKLLLDNPQLLLTWDGRAVVCYLSELDLARAFGLPINPPRPGENGHDRLHHPCQEFRGLLARPATCWCGWPRANHSSS